MSPTDSTMIETAARLGMYIIVISMMLVVYRIARGPKSADRIIALDLLSVLVVAFVALYAIFSGKVAFLDVAIAYALIAFLGTVAFARYLERSSPIPIKRQQIKAQGDRCD
jgi:multicomponent Na+:H+ antiporter subunit F